MPAVTIEMSSPLPSGFTGHLGGPGAGGHVSAQWYIAFGMDLGAMGGTPVFAAFDGHVTKVETTMSAVTSGKEFGAKIFMRDNTDSMGAYYTHITDVPVTLVKGATITRGDPLGTVSKWTGGHPHLHFALVEIVNHNYIGVALLKTFVDLSNTSDVSQVTFNQDGTPPTVSTP